MSKIHNPSKQKGLALFVSLIMLLVMTLIIVIGARSSTLELSMGNNSQHTAEALMRAEDSVVAAEGLIERNFVGGPKANFRSSQSDGMYVAGEINVNSVDWKSYPAVRTGSGQDLREYIIEYMGPARTAGGSLSVGAGAASDIRYVFRVSGRGASSRGGARVVQTIYTTAE